MPSSLFIINMLSQAKKSGDANRIAKARQLAAKLGQIPDTVAGIGSGLQTVATSSEGNSNVGLAGLGGGLQGFGAGLNAGILPAIGLGLVGAASGVQNAAQTNADYFDDKALSQQFELSSKTVSPSILGKGGRIIGGEDITPVQLEDEELYVTEDLSIYDSKADKKHEDMEDSDITDFVKANSYALSNRLEFNPEDYEDELLGYGLAHYNEDDDFELEEVKMGDVIKGKGPIPFSKAGDMIRKHFKVVDEDKDHTDLLTKITNQENKQARRPYLNRLIQIHEGQTEVSNQRILPAKYGKGGKIKKYNGGGFVSGLPNQGSSQVMPDGRRVSVDADGNITYLDELGPLDQMFNDLDADLDQFELQNQQDRDTSSAQYQALFGRMNNRNNIAAVGDLLTIGTQGTRYSPRLRSTSGADQMFEEVPNSVIGNVASSNFARVNSVAAQVARSNPALAQRILPRLMDTALARSNQESLALGRENRNQRRQKYRFLNTTENFNRGERIRAREATRDAINIKKGALGTAFNRFLTNRNFIDSNSVNVGRAVDNQFNTNRMNILRSRLGLGMTRTRQGLASSSLEERRNALSSVLNRNSAPASINPIEVDQDYLDEILGQEIYDLPIGIGS